MPGIARKGKDVAGGVGIEGSPNVFANGLAVMRHGDKVASHPTGNPHNATPPMIAGSRNVFVNGLAVVNQGDVATCGHSISGSGDVFVGD